MNLGLILAIGESLSDFKAKGQLARLINYNVKKYSKVFDKIFIFSYANENFKISKKIFLIANKSGIHRYLYAILLPFIHRKIISECDILRGLQLTGGIPAFLSKIFFGKKFVINYGYDYPSFAQIEGKHLQHYLYELIQNPILKSADAVVVTSKEIKKKISRTVKSSKIHYIPNGIDTKLFKPSKSRQTDQKFIKVAYLGRLEKQKNLDNLIKAVALLKFPTRLEFYGVGTQKKHLSDLAKKLKIELTIKNPVPYNKVPKILKRSDIFVLPSQEEGSPKILIEAMSCGKSVIGSDVIGIKELIIDGKTGIVTQTDPVSIANSIGRLKDTKIREKIGLSASTYVRQNFDLDLLLNQEIKILEKIGASL